MGAGALIVYGADAELVGAVEAGLMALVAIALDLFQSHRDRKKKDKN